MPKLYCLVPNVKICGCDIYLYPRDGEEAVPPDVVELFKNILDRAAKEHLMYPPVTNTESEDK